MQDIKRISLFEGCAFSLLYYSIMLHNLCSYFVKKGKNIKLN